MHRRNFVYVLSLTFALFQVYTAYHPFPDLLQRTVHAGLALAILFLIIPVRRDSKYPGILGYVLAGTSLLVVGYVAINYDDIIMRLTGSTPMEQILGWVAVLLMLEAARRSLGKILPILATASVAYAFFGPFLSGRWAHPGFSPHRVIEWLYFGAGGMWGTIMGISATVVAIYVIFGTVLLRSGGADTFRDLSLRLAGNATGGAAKTATVASALFGTVSGSAVANVVTTGAFTIPMMKRLGYPVHMAAAVEAAASTGGQIMPPIMGAAAFIMAELLGRPYTDIVIVATLPAVLYFLSVFMGIHFESRRLGLLGVDPKLMLPWGDLLTWRRLSPVVGPFGVLFTLLGMGYSVSYAGFCTVITAIGIFLVFGGATRQLGQRLLVIMDALVSGAQTLVSLVALIGVAQILITMINRTGLGVKFASVLMVMGGNSLFAGLILAMMMIMMLGMGIPTTGAYLLGTAVAAPALVALGLLPLSAHMFIFYFAILSAITPPVCTAVFVASNLAEAPWIQTAGLAVRLALAGFLIPFVFAYSPALLLQGDWVTVVWVSATTTLGIVALSAGVMGYVRQPVTILERGLFIGGAIMLIVPEWFTDAIGLLAICGAAALHFRPQRVTEKVLSVQVHGPK